eukprot:CAMPEP_0204604188 /NCGR_PEP_ID=MMETSP0661-20131031/57709_1 /ASSEMBLY_ACC=CAM_ASM_000606 /TAXON_ID=109239 /ORGANISM="Alexandrium margalefi, Strain AMGDE01CS-322" /LENGTH=182 /DNA_ID=CAMNT_0051615323 /DNA_START=38 /DNA_END=583 /DNA_ORIENTATION=-
MTGVAAACRQRVAGGLTRAAASRPRLLLLLAVESAQAAPSDLHDLEAHPGDVADRVAASPEAGDQHLIVLVDEVQTAVPGHEGGNLLAVLDELHAAAFADGGVRLLRLDADLLHHDALGVRAAAKGVALVLGPQVRLLVVLVRPQLRAPAVLQLARGPDSARNAAPHGFLFSGFGPRVLGSE